MLTISSKCQTIDDMDDKRITFRPKPDDRKIIELVRRHLKQTVGDEDDAKVIRFALKAAERELKKKT
jgi:hypothetical protein